jgi:hypothetical protein
MLERLQNVDRRIIYVLLFIVCFIPMANPIGIPLEVNETTQMVYDIVEGLNPSSDKVLFVMDYSVGGSADVHPQAVAVAKHLAKRGIPTVMVAFVNDGTMFAEQIITSLGDQVVYGTDVINLGYMAGMETAVKAFVEAPKTAFNVDFRGNSVASQPIMANVSSIRDFSFIIDFQTGQPGYQDFLRQLPPGMSYAAGIVTVSVPNVMPYLNSGQLSGLLQGLRGAAEYEVLLREPGEGSARMDAQSMAHVVIIAFILIGNAAYFLSRNKAGGPKA